MTQHIYFSAHIILFYYVIYQCFIIVYFSVHYIILLYPLSALYCYLFTFQYSIYLVLCNWNRATFSISKLNLTFSPSVILHIYNFFLDGFKLLSFIQVMFYIFLKRKKKNLLMIKKTKKINLHFTGKLHCCNLHKESETASRNRDSPLSFSDRFQKRKEKIS